EISRVEANTSNRSRQKDTKVIKSQSKSKIKKERQFRLELEKI
ncbi:246_t:CDS:1, partial [Scutellospora calospora]